MGWSFKAHGGIALALSAWVLLSVVLAWLPEGSPSAGMTWLVTLGVLFLVGVAAWVRVLLCKADKKMLWLAFRCLPGRLRAVLGVLAVTGVLLTLIGASQENDLQTDGVEDGRYYVYDTTPLHRGRAEVSRSAYEEVLRREQRSMLPVFGAAFAVIACLVFSAGEVRQADSRSKSAHAKAT
ncbi:hypothetical protein [Streptomyces albogriseolus]|uniref:hypothetical protein n=1 Tax=Streptomyces albogriseolus TaxID=1887 RepID=UPI00381E6163